MSARDNGIHILDNSMEIKAKIEECEDSCCDATGWYIYRYMVYILCWPCICAIKGKIESRAYNTSQ